MRRPGFTILELVIALGVVLFLGVVAGPALYERLGDSRLEAAGRDIAAVIAAVRADAVREGRALEVRAERADGVVRVVSAPLQQGEPKAGGQPAGPRPLLRTELPAGVAASESLPSAGGEAQAVLAGRPASAGTVETAGDPVILGVLLPDGTAWSARAVYLSLEKSPARALEVKLNSWTGVATVTEVPMAAVQAPEAVEVPAP